MISAAFPGFLIAAAVFAAVPVALHLLARRPPARAALPTARFLREDPRTLLRLQRRPTDAWLLVVRVVFALALGTAFAGVSWMPGRSGAVRVVLVDAGADATVSWSDAVEAVRGAVSDESRAGDGATGDRGAVGESHTAITVAYGLDGGARVVDLDELAGLERGSRAATVEDGLRALRETARTEGFARADVVWVGRPSWRGWSPGLGLTRAQLWPGRVQMRPIAGGRDEDVSAETRSGDVSGETPAEDVSSRTRGDPPVTPVALLVGEAPAGPLGRAVEALGGRVVGATGGGSGPAEARSGATGASPVTTGDEQEAEPKWIFVSDGSSATLGPLLDRARSGATLVLSGPLAEPADAVPWVVGGSAAGVGQLLLSGDRAVGAPVERLPGKPAVGARTVAVFDDGTPAAAAGSLGEGCVGYLAARLTAPELTSSPGYPELIRTLAHGCDDPAALDGPLDRGALTAIERPDLPATVDVASLVATEGIELTPWLVLLALALLGVEVAMTRERRA